MNTRELLIECQSHNELMHKNAKDNTGSDFLLPRVVKDKAILQIHSMLIHLLDSLTLAERTRTELDRIKEIYQNRETYKGGLTPRSIRGGETGLAGDEPNATKIVDQPKESIQAGDKVWVLGRVDYKGSDHVDVDFVDMHGREETMFEIPLSPSRVVKE